ncbi:hypothetical protein [Nocardia carnea]|uniref:hypothetical protein n=1 Tax=Nocardia carnea TaxID=37328 RepID=UPI002455919E|nr:hypothetical protein [Nocardia carnea]
MKPNDKTVSEENAEFFDPQGVQRFIDALKQPQQNHVWGQSAVDDVNYRRRWDKQRRKAADARKPERYSYRGR